MKIHVKVLLALVLNMNLMADSVAVTDDEVAKYAASLNKYYENIKNLEKKCDAGNTSDCYEVGKLHETSPYKKLKGFENSEINAVYYYKKACDNNHSNACNDAGVLFYRNAKNNKTAALQYLDKACKLKNQTGCENLEILIKEIKQKWREILENQKLNIVCQDGKGGKYEYPKQTGILLISTKNIENLEFFFENSCEVIKK